MKENGILVWNNGKREPTTAGGGMRIIVPHRSAKGRMLETTFELDSVPEAGLPSYVETSTRDVNHIYRELEATSMVERARRSGVSLPSYVLQGRYPEETDEEFRRRRVILSRATQPEGQEP